MSRFQINPHKTPFYTFIIVKCLHEPLIFPSHFSMLLFPRHVVYKIGTWFIFLTHYKLRFPLHCFLISMELTFTFIYINTSSLLPYFCSVNFYLYPESINFNIFSTQIADYTSDWSILVICQFDKCYVCLLVF